MTNTTTAAIPSSRPLSGTDLSGTDLSVAPPAEGIGDGTMLAILVMAQFMALLDATIVNVAIPSIQKNMHASGAGLQFIVAGYTVAYAMLLITGARLGSLVGHKRLFITGLITFTTASFLCGVAPTTGVLIASRVVQGIGAAAMVPQTLSIIQKRFTGASRARAFSVYGAAISIGGVTGQVLGGVLVDLDIAHSAWRSIFFVNVPVGVLAVVLATRKLPADGAIVGRVRDGLDVIGLLLGSAAVLLLVLPLVLGRQEGWPAWTFIALAAGVVLAVVFVLAERRVAATGGRPLLDLEVVRSPGLPSALVALAAGMIGYGAFLFVFAFHLQGGLGESPLRAGLTFAPAGAGFGLVGFFWRKLPTAWHPSLPVVGFSGAAIGYLLVGLGLRDGSTGGYWLVPLMLVLGAFMGAAFSPLLAHGLVRVPPARAADASGLLTTVLQLSIVLGITVFGDLFLSLSTHIGPHPSAAAFGTVLLTLCGVSIAGLLGAVPLARSVRHALHHSEQQRSVELPQPAE
jgi:EmrB/QacA subfamily drug resistance transporter